MNLTQAVRLNALTCVCTLLALAPSPAGVPPAAAGAKPLGSMGVPVSRTKSLRRPHLRKYTTCSGTGLYSFIGGSGGPSTPNIADGDWSGVLSGADNEACGTASGVGVGDENTTTTVGADGFIGGGSSNTVNSNGSGILAGGDNSTGGVTSNGIVAGLDNVNNGWSSLIGAGQGNTTSSAVTTSGCGGGCNAAIVAGYENQVNGSYLQGTDSLIGSGKSNTLTGNYAAIVAGQTNSESGDYGFDGAGYNNTVSGQYGSIGGGKGNTASGSESTVPGGLQNVASGLGSFAAGRGANAVNAGAFVWSDSTTGSTVESTAADQFVARATGGFFLYTNSTLTTGVTLPAGSGSWSSVSDRAAKTGIVPVDDAEVLARVAALPVSTWSYISEGSGVRHLGPMAQDFRAAFGIGEDDRHIAVVDEGGVALAAIKGLKLENDRLRGRLALDESRDASLQRRLSKLQSQVDKLISGD